MQYLIHVSHLRLLLFTEAIVFLNRLTGRIRLKGEATSDRYLVLGLLRLLYFLTCTIALGPNWKSVGGVAIENGGVP